jgi:hypothetical protein
MSSVRLSLRRVAYVAVVGSSEVGNPGPLCRKTFSAAWKCPPLKPKEGLNGPPIVFIPFGGPTAVPRLHGNRAWVPHISLMLARCGSTAKRRVKCRGEPTSRQHQRDVGHPSSETSQDSDSRERVFRQSGGICVLPLRACRYLRVQSDQTARILPSGS